MRLKHCSSFHLPSFLDAKKCRYANELKSSSHEERKRQEKKRIEENVISGFWDRIQAMTSPSREQITQTRVKPKLVNDPLHNRCYPCYRIIYIDDNELSTATYDTHPGRTPLTTKLWISNVSSGELDEFFIALESQPMKSRYTSVDVKEV